MDITVTVPESFFLTFKTPTQIAEELKQAALIFWRARGDISSEVTDQIKAVVPPVALPEGGTLMDLLMQMPDVGEDADFERPVSYGRPDVDLD
jgi:hypothetical protein